MGDQVEVGVNVVCILDFVQVAQKILHQVCEVSNEVADGLLCRLDLFDFINAVAFRSLRAFRDALVPACDDCDAIREREVDQEDD